MSLPYTLFPPDVAARARPVLWTVLVAVLASAPARGDPGQGESIGWVERELLVRSVLNYEDLHFTPPRPIERGNDACSVLIRRTFATPEVVEQIRGSRVFHRRSMLLDDGSRVVEVSASERLAGRFVVAAPLYLKADGEDWSLAEFPACSEFAVLLHESRFPGRSKTVTRPGVRTERPEPISLALNAHPIPLPVEGDRPRDQPDRLPRANAPSPDGAGERKRITIERKHQFFVSRAGLHLALSPTADPSADMAKASPALGFLFHLLRSQAAEGAVPGGSTTIEIERLAQIGAFTLARYVGRDGEIEQLAVEAPPGGAAAEATPPPLGVFQIWHLASGQRKEITWDWILEQAL